MIWIYLFLGAIIAVFLLLQITPYIQAHRYRGRRAPPLAGFLTPNQATQQQLLFYFGNPSCGMCGPVSRVIDALQSERDDIVKVDVSRTPALAHAFGVRATPTLVLVRKGVIERVLPGARTEQGIRALLEREAA